MTALLRPPVSAPNKAAHVQGRGVWACMAEMQQRGMMYYTAACDQAGNTAVMYPPSLTTEFACIAQGNRKLVCDQCIAGSINIMLVTTSAQQYTRVAQGVPPADASVLHPA
jgi:hypothetical protein